MRTFKSSEASKCWKIGSPCSKSNSKTSGLTSQSGVKVAQVEQSEDGNLRVFCDVKKYYVKATSESSVGFKPSCNAGTYRSRFDKCARGFWGWKTKCTLLKSRHWKRRGSNNCKSLDFNTFPFSDSIFSLLIHKPTNIRQLYFSTWILFWIIEIQSDYFKIENGGFLLWVLKQTKFYWVKSFGMDDHGLSFTRRK
jgi:hypothetical protein